MYKEFKGLNLPEIDKEILQFWKSENIFEKSIGTKDVSNPYVFYEGPPSANGMPGIHHVMARTVKDLFCRFHTMLGQRVERKGGWDTHGLPIELSVEKELSITKEDIGKSISVDEYNHKCRETVMRYKKEWDNITEQMGYWVDLDNPYITFENNYIESVWHLLQLLYNKGLLYKGYTIQPYSPAAGTGLSTHELNQPGCYREVTDTSVVAMFKVIKDERAQFLFDDEDEDVRIIAWTTTPWTLPSNTALTVGSKIEYVKIKTINPYTKQAFSAVLANELVNSWFGEKKAEILSKSDVFSGEKLKGISYEQLLPFAQPEDGDAFKVITGDFVTTQDGTGIVHTAPSFGADDMRVARANGIGSLTLVDKQGRFTAEAGEFARRYVKDYKDDPNYVNVDIDIAVKLKQENKAFNVQKFVHNYPHCWRTDKPVLYYPLDSWFIKTTAMKDRMVELNKTINWKPASTGQGRFTNWLENLQDWNLSRSRFWGIPLPVWRTKEADDELCIGSVEELKKKTEQANKALNLQQSVPTDLHRPYIDEVVLYSEKTGKPMYRELDLIDVWFDSGSMPYAQWHYPFENVEKFKANFPADFIAEGVDQTRGWFFTLHAIATMAFDSIAFKNVVSNGLVQDKFGRKMSKRLGNTVEPFETIAKYGADATRWYMISNAQPWDNLKFDIEGIDEVRRKFFGTMYNTYSFFALYANIDGFKYSEARVPVSKRPEIDRWIISKLNSLIVEVFDFYADYEPTNAARAIQDFVDSHLSNWYVRLCRRRFWKGEYTEDKITAYQTLYECMNTIAKLMAPVAPFFADWLYLNLNTVTESENYESVHLATFPEEESSAIDPTLEERMDYAQRISSLILSIRKKEKIRVRQPLLKALLPVLDDRFQKQVEAVQDLIMAEVNVKSFEFVTNTAGVISKTIKANFKTLGKRLGKDMKAAADMISQFDQETIRQIEQQKYYVLNIGDTSYTLEQEDFEIGFNDIPGWQVASDRDLTVALDITLNDDLIAEGTARDLINRIQNIRKTSDLNVTDRIIIKLESNDAVNVAIDKFADYICSETLADSLTTEKEVNGERLELFEDVIIGIEVLPVLSVK